MFSMSHEQLINIVAFCSTPGAEGTAYTHKQVEESTTQKMLDEFAGWEPESFKEGDTLLAEYCFNRYI